MTISSSGGTCSLQPLDRPVDGNPKATAAIKGPEPYPVDALGKVLAPAARAIAAKVQCAEALAAQSVLSIASLAAQAIADVCLPYGQTRPLSLFCLTIAHSGDRKTTADSEAMAPVRMRERQLRDQYEPRAKRHAIDLAAWRAQKGQIDRGRTDLEARTQKLTDLGPEPVPPLKPILTVGESTAEGLAKNWPQLPGALGIFSAEGGQFLGGHGFAPEAKLRTAASFAQLWDGSGLRRIRAGDGLVDLHGRRMACHLMIQPEAAADVLNDMVLRDQGLLSRLLIAWPETLAGSRFWKDSAAELEPALRHYVNHTLAIFEQPIASTNEAGNELAPRVLELTADARRAWVVFHDDVERDQGTGAILSTLRDVAGKAAEQAARIAGVLAVIGNHQATAIEGGTMSRGCDLMRWYLREALRVSMETADDPTKKDARLLQKWIEHQGAQYVTASFLLTRGPNKLRQKEKLDPVIKTLESNGWLIPDGTAGRAWKVASSFN